MSAQKIFELAGRCPDIEAYTINLQTLEKKCPLDQLSPCSSLPPKESTPIYPLGRLDDLPHEILSSILHQVDLQTLTDFRSLNRQARIIVNSLSQYKDVVVHAPHALRAILSTGMAPSFTPSQLSDALRSQECCLCGSFGGFLFLLDCRRCCGLCLAEAPELLPIQRSEAKTRYGLRTESLWNIPIFKGIPGSYSSGNRPRSLAESLRRLPISIVSKERLRLAGIKLHGSEDAMEAFVAKAQEWQPGPMIGRARAYRRARTSTYCNYEPWRFVAAIRFPTFDISTGKSEWGVSCRACKSEAKDGDKQRGWMRMYTESGYLAHFGLCKRSQEDWARLRRSLLPSKADQNPDQVS